MEWGMWLDEDAEGRAERAETTLGCLAVGAFALGWLVMGGLLIWVIVLLLRV